jgi:hypothetical protein
MTTVRTNPVNYVARYDAAEALLKGKATPAAVAAHLIQLTASSNPQADAMGFEGQRKAITDLVQCGGADEARANAVLAVTNSVLRASAKISTEHREILVGAAALRAPGASPPAPTFEVARAFLSQFLDAGTKAGLEGSHNDWFIDMGPGSGKTFLETPSANAIEERATKLASKKGVAVADKHRVAAADELAKENKVAFEERGAAGRVFGLPFDTLEKVGGFALEKTTSNNRESVEAAALGLLAHLSGKDVQIDQSLNPAEYKAALASKIGDLDDLRAQLRSNEGRSWSQLTDKEKAGATAYFGSMLGELAELRMGLLPYEKLSPATSSMLSTTHDVYVHMRTDWLFNDSNGEKQAKPLNQLDKKTKDADIPPFLFALHGMVAEAQRSAEMAKAS